MSEEVDNLKPGDQIAYIPNHVPSNTMDHPDIEFGFITSIYGTNRIFCRYWCKGELGQLRTVANSECTPVDMLKKHKSVPDAMVTKTIQMFKNDPERFGYKG